MMATSRTRAARPRSRAGAGLTLIATRVAAGMAAGIVALTAWCPARAGEPRHIELTEAIQIALQQNSTLRRAENASMLDRTAVSQATMSFVPDLRLSVSGSRSYAWSSVAGEPGSVSSGSARAGLSTGLVLFDGLGNVADLRQARLEEDAGLLELERARQTVVFQVMTDWLTMIEAQEQVRVREENLTAQEDQERQVRALVEGGTRPISDLYQQQAAVASARLTLVETRRTYELSCIDLVQQLQLDPTGEYIFEVPPLPEAETESTEPDQAALLAQALAGRRPANGRNRRRPAGGRACRCRPATVPATRTPILAVCWTSSATGSRGPWGCRSRCPCSIAWRRAARSSRPAWVGPTHGSSSPTSARTSLSRCGGPFWM
jgi:outer membrane protein